MVDEEVKPPDRLINTHDQLVANGGGMAIVQAYSGGRGPITQCGWAVLRYNATGARLITNEPTGPWYEHGSRHFYYHGGRDWRANRERALALAMLWVRVRYDYVGGITWARNRMGDYVPATVNRKFPLEKRPRSRK